MSCTRFGQIGDASSACGLQVERKEIDMFDTNRKVHIPTDDEEKDIQRQILQDPDAPEWTDEDWGRARPALEVDPEIVEWSRRTRGRQKAPTKELISIRLDADLASHFRASGKGWQTRLNDTLRKAVFGHRNPLSRPHKRKDK